MSETEERRDAFGQELNLNDLVVYAVGQGHSAGGLRFGRVKNTERPIFTSICELTKWVWDEPGKYDWRGKPDREGHYTVWHNDWRKRVERKGHYEITGYAEESPRKIKSFKQVMRVNNYEEVLKNQPGLLKFVKELK